MDFNERMAAAKEAAADMERHDVKAVGAAITRMQQRRVIESNPDAPELDPFRGLASSGGAANVPSGSAIVGVEGSERDVTLAHLVKMQGVRDDELVDACLAYVGSLASSVIATEDDRLFLERLQSTAAALVRASGVALSADDFGSSRGEKCV